MSIFYNVFVKPVLFRMFGKPMKIVRHGYIGKGEYIYQPQVGGTRWVKAIPLLEVCEDTSPDDNDYVKVD